MRVWLIRHGETEYNKERRYQGRLDIPLAEKGKIDLLRSARRPETVYVTPLQRTREKFHGCGNCVSCASCRL